MKYKLVDHGKYFTREPEEIKLPVCPYCKKVMSIEPVGDCQSASYAWECYCDEDLLESKMNEIGKIHEAYRIKHYLEKE